MFVRTVLILANSILIHATLLNLTCQQIKQFVDGHNHRRLSIAKGKIQNQPAGNNLKQMIWDEEIAQKAANWAEQKKFQHNPDITLPSKRFETGENLYLHRSTDPNFVLNLDVSIREWFDEHKNYRFKKLEFRDFQSSKVIGHYTQMVWADTMYIGCAVSKYQDGKWNSFLVVCNYAPRGNKLDDHPYDTQGRRTNGLLCDLPNCNGIYGKSCS